MTPLACAGWLGGRRALPRGVASLAHEGSLRRRGRFADDPGLGAEGAALVLPACNTEAMKLHLAEIAAEVAPRHAVLVVDQAGWHLSAQSILFGEDSDPRGVPPPQIMST